MKENNKSIDRVVVNDCWNSIGVWSGPNDRCPRLESVIHCRNCPIYSSAGRQLLDQQVSESYIAEWTNVFSRMTKLEKTKKLSAFVFRTGGEWLALPAKLIQEVVDMGIIHSLPHRNSALLRGVVNIRGKLELCFSLGAVLGIDRFEKLKEKSDKYISPSRLVVATLMGERIVFPVSEVYGSFRYAEGMLQQLPVTVSGSKAAFTKGILCIDDMDVGFLDEKFLFDALTRNM